MSSTYILQSASFKGTTITDVTQASIQETSTPTNISTDGSRNVNLVVVDGKTATVTVESTSQLNSATANFRVGQAGALVLVTKLRTAGDAVSTTSTCTFAEAVCVSNTTSEPTAGAGSHQMTFQCHDASNDGIMAWT